MRLMGEEETLPLAELHRSRVPQEGGGPFLEVKTDAVWPSVGELWKEVLEEWEAGKTNCGSFLSLR